MKYLENYIKRIQNTETINDAFAAFSSIIEEHGYERIAYSLVTDHPSNGYTW